jgi:hypothetical protein
MKRGVASLALVALACVTTAATPAGAAQKANHVSTSARTSEYAKSFCELRTALCTDPFDTIAGRYIGHDEPSVIFYSNRHGSGNDVTYTLRLPKDPPELPTQDGKGGTWNFQLRPTFWLGMALCDNQSSPEFTHERCRPDSNANNFTSLDPNSPRYIGKHPGNAFMELQFYPPGYVRQFTGFSCAARQYCAAMAIFSLSLDQNTNVVNNDDCLNNFPLVGLEPANFAYITKSGRSQGPANPISTSREFLRGIGRTLNPDPHKALFMNPGDRLRIHMHDTSGGLRIDIDDLTSGRTGSMTASKANGFGHVLFQPKSKHCHMRLYAFHPMYDTAVRRGTTWAAHTYNIAASDEIGHFEYCDHINENGGVCVDPGVGDRKLDSDDVNCFNGKLSTLVKIIGCFTGIGDTDFDGPSYQRDWPGTFRNVALDRRKHPEPIMFTSPTTRGHQFSNVAFEADLPRIEAEDFNGNCDRDTGKGCTNPPPGARFYPIYTTTRVNGTCVWEQGGPLLPGILDDFGGSSKTEYARLLNVPYPVPGGIDFRFNNFRRILGRNPCPAR